MADLAGFYRSVLSGLGVPVTQQALANLAAWQRAEGGWTNNAATFNPLNTTHGSQYPSMNPVGVRVYPDFQTGVRMTVDTLKLPYYKDVIANIGAPLEQFAQTVYSSPWGTKHGIAPGAAPTAAGVAAPAASPSSAPAPARTFDLKSANSLARAFGFKSFSQAFGLTNSQARTLIKSSNAVLAPTQANPNRVLFSATPTPKRDGKGVAELFYDPAGQHRQWDQGQWINPIGNHSDHVHVSFSNPQTALTLIQIAQDMGLRVGENPYVDPVDGNHVSGSFHYKTFPGQYGGKSLGEAIDVSGPSDLMMRFYETARRYVG